MARTAAVAERTPRRREATREQLLATADRCFLERGYHGSTVEWLAAEAGYTTGAIYSSFGGKAGLFEAIVERRGAVQIEGWRRAAASADPESAVAEMLTRTLGADDFIGWYAVYIEYLATVIRDPASRSRLAASYRRSQGAVREALQPLALRSSLDDAEFSLLATAASNGLALMAVIEPLDTEGLMRTLLTRLSGTGRNEG
jgi:AcrR family transcriptional regulator